MLTWVVWTNSQLKIVITQYRVVVSRSYLEANTRTTPTPSGAQNGCHGNAGCLATETLNLHFEIEYFKNAKAYKLQNRHISSRCVPGRM